MFLWPDPYLARVARQLRKPRVISARGILMPVMGVDQSVALVFRREASELYREPAAAAP